jgi:hypothetical protein
VKGHYCGAAMCRLSPAASQRNSAELVAGQPRLDSRNHCREEPLIRLSASPVPVEQVEIGSRVKDDGHGTQCRSHVFERVPSHIARIGYDRQQESLVGRGQDPDAPARKAQQGMDWLAASSVQVFTYSRFHKQAVLEQGRHTTVNFGTHR